ncbi:MAG: glycosyltransferase family 9 protein [Tannerellaceae bacterium]|jgi:heptosyltransferase-2|nr:glycosyltransferase family 9 protein [Tannerellaceae bacterium]
MREIKNIIILRFRRVGDSVLSSPLCSSLRKTFPEARIDYVLNEEIGVLFEGHPDIDRVITFKKEEMKDARTYLTKVRRIMRSGQYDLIIDTRSTVKTLWFALFSLTTPYRIGRRKAYNRLLHNYRPDTAIEDDEVGRALRLLSPLEKKFDVHYDRTLKLYVSPEEKASFRRLMADKGIDFSKPVLLCAVTARLTYKVWDMERISQVLQSIIDQYEAQLIFNFGGPEEEEAALRLQEDMGNHPRIFTNIKANNLRELSAMLTNADFFFGNEGGPRHISQALNIPSFAIYPPSVSKKYWLPNACERFQGIEVADISERALDNTLSFKEKFDLLTVDAVWEKLNPMLTKYIIKIINHEEEEDLA